MMRIAVLSDIHANAHALEAVLRDCEAQKADTFWLLGDYVDYCAATESVLKTVESLNAGHIIAGNHDACLFDTDIRPSATEHGKASYEYLCRYLQEKPHVFEWLRSISGCAAKVIKEEKTMLVHGTPFDPYWGKFDPESPNEISNLFAYMEENDILTLFAGHIHKSFMITGRGRMIINPGSVGQPRNGCPHAQYVIFEDGNARFRRVPYDIQATADEIERAGLPMYLRQRLFLGK